MKKSIEYLKLFLLFAMLPVILLLMGWIAANGEKIDTYCKNFWK